MRLDIEGLRALAVTLVVFAHAGSRRFAGGYVGVDVFFVISGFLITSLLLRELEATGRVSVRAFYARRALRLLPAATLVTVATLAGSWLFLSKIRFEEYAGDALASVLQLVNFRLASRGTDYLAETAPPSPFQHFWSLAVEEQFYLLWPLLLLGSWRLTRGRRRPRALLALPLLALCCASFALSLSVTASSPPWGYFGSHTRAWELGAGALLAVGARRLALLPAWLAAPMTWAGLGCVALAALRFDEATPFPGHHAALPVAGAALVLAGGCAPARLDARLILARRPAVWVGRLSYGWYLWHWPLLLIGPRALGRSPDVRLGLALSGAALLLAWVSLRLVENPVRFHRSFRGRPARGLGVGLGLSAAAVAAALVAAAFPPPIGSGAPAPSLRRELAAAPAPQARLAELLAEAGTSLPSNLSPPLAEVADTRSAVYRDGCHAGNTSAVARPCVYGDPSSDEVVVLFGDSHAAQWFPAVERLARERGWRLISLTKASCKVAEVTTVREGRPYESCDAWRANALEEIRRARPSLVIAASSDAGDLAHPQGPPLRQWTAGYASAFRDLTATGARVAVLLDTPWPRENAAECAAIHPLALDRCTTRLPDALQDPTRRTATTTAAETTGVTVIDPLPWLCSPTGTCPLTAADTFLYRDDNHITETYAETLAPLLAAHLPLPGGR